MIILYLVETYAILGVIFSIPFLSKWIYSVDEGAHGTTWMFKLAIFPGCVLLWPSLLSKYLKVRRTEL